VDVFPNTIQDEQLNTCDVRKPVHDFCQWITLLKKKRVGWGEWGDKTLAISQTQQFVFATESTSRVSGVSPDANYCLTELHGSLPFTNSFLTSKTHLNELKLQDSVKLQTCTSLIPLAFECVKQKNPYD